MGIREEALFSYTGTLAFAVASYVWGSLKSTDTHRLTCIYENLDGWRASQGLALVGASPLHKEETGTHNPGNLRNPYILSRLPRSRVLPKAISGVGQCSIGMRSFIDPTLKLLTWRLRATRSPIFSSRTGEGFQTRTCILGP